MATKTEATRETRTDSSAPGMRNQGLVSGQAHEFAIILPLKPGGGKRMRDRLTDSVTAGTQALDKMGTLHDLRFVLFDNDTRVIFASTYDGGFEQYIKDFATLVPDLIIAQYQSEAIVFYSAYPNVTVKQVWKGQRVLKAFEELLDEASS